MIASESEGENIVLNFRPKYNVLRLTDRQGCPMGLLYMLTSNFLKYWME